MTKTASNKNEPQSRGFIRDNLDIMFSDAKCFGILFTMVSLGLCGRACEAAFGTALSAKTATIEAGTKIKTKIQDHFPLGK